jgi:hypothetical protein
MREAVRDAALELAKRLVGEQLDADMPEIAKAIDAGLLEYQGDGEFRYPVAMSVRFVPRGKVCKVEVVSTFSVRHRGTLSAETDNPEQQDIPGLDTGRKVVLSGPAKDAADGNHGTALRIEHEEGDDLQTRAFVERATGAGVPLVRRRGDTETGVLLDGKWMWKRWKSAVRATEAIEKAKLDGFRDLAEIH